MIERIYIPTIRRPKLQVTYENLPAELQQRVIMVIDGSERHLYEYDCEYLELPEFIVGEYTQLAMTRKYIHEHAGQIKYAMIDDDLDFYTRNMKYFGKKSNMDTAQRNMTHYEFIDFFDLADRWLNEDHIGIVGMSDGSVPVKKLYEDTKSACGVLFCDGQKISKIIDQIDTSTRVAEDIMFMFTCLTNGINSRRSNLHVYRNGSDRKDYRDIRPVWEGLFAEKMPDDYFQTLEHYNALMKVKKKFPKFIDIYEKDGRVKNTKHWKKAYEYGRTVTDVTETQHYLESIRNG
jgi:hypothetical protein